MRVLAVPWSGCLPSEPWSAGNLAQPQLTVLDDFVGEVLPDVDVLGTFPSADDVVTPLNARRGVFVSGRG